MQVEHFELQSQSPGRRNLYSNCFLICRLCNVARGIAAIHAADSRALLNPCSHTWSEAFELVGETIRPRNVSNGDATYTRDAYDLNDPHKARMRKLRRETIEEALAYLRRPNHLEQELLDRAIATADPVLLDAAETIRNDRINACRDLQQFLAVPDDHDRACHCGHKRYHSLPWVLAEQTFDIGRDCATHSLTAPDSEPA